MFTNTGLGDLLAGLRAHVHRDTQMLPREVKTQHLAGVAEADETYLLRSYKGQRRRLRAEQTRKPRHRGGRAAKRCVFRSIVTAHFGKA